MLRTEYCSVLRGGFDMEQNTKQSERRKQELIATALKLFYENGYEKTSIREILKEVGGEVGMFYHYFKSKDEIFELAIEYYLNEYIQKFSEVSKNSSLSFKQSLESLIALQSETIRKYKIGWSNKIHWSMASAIYKKTLQCLIPYIEDLINKALKNKEIIIRTPNVSIHELTLFLVYGISGILHEKPLLEITQMELTKKQQNIRNLLMQFFIWEEE